MDLEHTDIGGLPLRVFPHTISSAAGYERQHPSPDTSRSPESLQDLQLNMLVLVENFKDTLIAPLTEGRWGGVPVLEDSEELVDVSWPLEARKACFGDRHAHDAPRHGRTQSFPQEQEMICEQPQLVSFCLQGHPFDSADKGTLPYTFSSCRAAPVNYCS